MKKLLLLVFFIPILFGCDEIEKEQKKLALTHKFLDGKHKLQRITSGSEFSASFFLIAGSAGTRQTVSFSWQSFDSIWNFTTINLDELRVKIIPGKEPTIEFLLGSNNSLKYFDYPEDVDRVAYYLHNATVECDVKYWTPNINLPLGHEQ